MANAVDVTIRVNYFAPPRRFSAVLGDSALLEAAFTDANGLPCFPTDAAITVQPPATVDHPMPDPIVLTMTSTPPLVILNSRYVVEIAPGWTGAWGVRASCTTPAYAAQDAGFDIMASANAVAAPESPTYPPQVLADPTGASATAAAGSALAAAQSAQQAASSGSAAGATAGATAGASAGAQAIVTAGLDGSTTAGRALLKAADAAAQRIALALASVAQSGAYADLSGRPALATVAASGAYADLSGKPSLGGAAPLNVGTAAGTVAAGDDSRITGAATSAALTAHTGNTSNPHNVTRAQIGAAASGANGDITSLSGLTTPLSVAQGGTGAATFGAAMLTWFNALPTTLPATSGVLWNNGGTLALS